MRLPKDLTLAVSLARFAREHSVDPADVAELIALARRVFKAGDGGSEGAEQKAGAAFEEKAYALGFAVKWPGLWPVLSRADRDIHLPS